MWANVSDPTLPIVAFVDTLGVANRLHVYGDTLYVTDMSGEGLYSRLNIVDISNPVDPTMIRTVELQPAREDYVPDGAYDVVLSGNKAFVTVMYSDQEDTPSQSLVEIIDLQKLADPTEDPTVPVVIHRHPTENDFTARDVAVARGAVHVAAGRQGLQRIEFSELGVLKHFPADGEDFVNTGLERILIELTGVVDASIDPADYVIVQISRATYRRRCHCLV